MPHHTLECSECLQLSVPRSAAEPIHSDQDVRRDEVLAAGFIGDSQRAIGVDGFEHAP